jgi:DNA polymerase delta subunit 1
MISFQAVAWEGYDDEAGQYIVRAYGRTEDGRSVAASTVFEPYFFVKMGARIPEARGSKIAYVSAKDLWGFQNGTRSRFAKLTFQTHKEFRSAMYSLQREKWRIYEANLDPVLRFMHVSGCTSTGWIQVTDVEDDPDTRCDINLRGTLAPVVGKDSVAPLKVMSFDIECYSSTGAFPDPKIAGDCVFQIGMTTKNFGADDETMVRKCLCLKQTDGPDCVSFKTEKELLEAFGRYLSETDPDIITGWNIFGFDLEFLFVRASRLGVETLWGRRTDLPSELSIKHLASSALGSNELKMVPMVGRYVFDLFQDIKREHKLESYSLNNVSKHFLKDQKLDMPVKEIFSRFLEGDPAKLGEVAEYCIQDTVLPHKIMAKVCQLQNQIEMAKACWVPLSFLSERGQQIKVFSQMAYKARQIGFLIPTIRRPEGPVDGYEGATVLEAQTGAYYTPITALDFASLYPSIMVAHNLCYSTLVIDKRYANLPGVTYETYGEHTFAQTGPDGAPITSLLPSILTDLKAFRKKAKKLQAQAKGTPMEAVYNGQQLAYKISMNSIYGFTGASKGMLPCVAIASTVTMRGRQMIEETKNAVEANFPGAKVRYGDTDSVMIEFDVEGRTGQDAIDYSWSQGLLAAEQCTKLFKAPNDLELEKVYCPYFLYSKKRYAAKMYEGMANKDGTPILKADGTQLVAFTKVDIKGLQVVRRDSSPFVRETLKKLLDMMLESSDPRPVIAFARQASEALSTGKVSADKLMMSKQLGSDYKVGRDGVVAQPHVAVRDKIRARAPGSEPQQGDRVAFVVVQGQGKLYEKAEDPAWVKEKGIPLDYQYYFLNQLKKPICDLLEPLVGTNPERLIFGAATAGSKKGTYDPKMKSIDSYFKKAS